MAEKSRYWRKKNTSNAEFNLNTMYYYSKWKDSKMGLYPVSLSTRANQLVLKTGTVRGTWLIFPFLFEKRVTLQGHRTNVPETELGLPLEVSTLFKLESGTALTHCFIPMMPRMSIIGGLAVKWAEGGWPLWSNKLVSQLKSLVWPSSGTDASLKDSYTVIWCIVCLWSWSINQTGDAVGDIL